MQGKVFYKGSHTLCVPTGQRADPSGKANSARCPEKKEVREEGAVRAGLLQVGLQSFLQRVFAPNEPPLSHPKRHQETLRMIPKRSQNDPK